MSLHTMSVIRFGQKPGNLFGAEGPMLKLVIIACAILYYL